MYKRRLHSKFPSAIMNKRKLNCLTQAQKMLDQLKSFFEKCDETPNVVFDNLINLIENAVIVEKAKKARQTTITEFF